MQAPFPDEIDVPYGLVTTRLICGLPVWLFALLLLLGVAPLYLWGVGKWWVGGLALGLGWLLSGDMRDDPQMLSAWRGEFGLKDYYD